MSIKKATIIHLRSDAGVAHLELERGNIRPIWGSLRSTE